MSEYFDAVKALTNITYPTNVGGDFLPLDEGLYWTVWFVFNYYFFLSDFNQ